MGCCCSSSSRVGSVKQNARSFPDSFDGFEGPVRNRECTDSFFLFIFAVYIIFLLVGVGLAFVNGDPRRLLFGYDDYGNMCGFKNKPINGANRSSVDYKKERYLVINEKCVKEDCRMEKICQDKCPDGYENTTFHRCLPTKVKQTTSKLLQSTLPFLEEMGSDISLCWKEIILLCLISIGLSVLLLIVLRFCASIIIWAVLIIVTIGSLAITVYIWYMWHEKKKRLEEYDGPNKDLKERRVMYWLIAAVLSTIFTVIYILVIIFMRNKIKLVAALFEEAGKAVAAMPLILLQPVETFISLVAASCFLLFGFVCLQTSGKPLVDREGRVTFPIESFFQVMRWLSLFGFVWVTQFILACQNLVVAGAVSTWYFTRDKDRLGSPIWRSFSNLICYHLGSAAFGSLIIATMKLIRALFRLLQKYLDQGNQNQRCEMCWKIFHCCLACFENYLKFLSKNAYIMIVIYGQSFCASARRSFGSLTSNIGKVMVVDCIGDFVFFVGKMGVTIAVVFIALEVLKDMEGLHYIWGPVAITGVFAFLSCHCFLSVYEMTIDTLLLCFCEDCNMNDGVTRPYFMSRSLMALIEGSRKSARMRPVSKRKVVD